MYSYILYLSLSDYLVGLNVELNSTKSQNWTFNTRFVRDFLAFCKCFISWITLKILKQTATLFINPPNHTIIYGDKLFQTVPLWLCNKLSHLVMKCVRAI